VPVNIGTVTELCSENYNRVCLYLCVSGAQSCFVSPLQNVTVQDGILLGPNAVPWLVVRFAEDGPLVGQRWLGSSAGATTVHVLEVIRDREPGTKWVLIPELEYAQRQLQEVYDPLRQFFGDAAVQPK
jgi:hypothetical protein